MSDTIFIFTVAKIEKAWCKCILVGNLLEMTLTYYVCSDDVTYCADVTLFLHATSDGRPLPTASSCESFIKMTFCTIFKAQVCVMYLGLSQIVSD